MDTEPGRIDKAVVLDAAWRGADATAGGNALDATVIPAVARTGRAQDLADAVAVGSLWAGGAS